MISTTDAHQKSETSQKGWLMLRVAADVTATPTATQSQGSLPWSFKRADALFPEEPSSTERILVFATVATSRQEDPGSRTPDICCCHRYVGVRSRVLQQKTDDRNKIAIFRMWRIHTVTKIRAKGKILHGLVGIGSQLQTSTAK